jgi:hypothetical protein
MAQKSAKQNEKELRELTAAERKAIDKYLIRSKAKPTVRFKISNNATGAKIQLDHPHGTIGHALLMDAFGSADREFVDGLLSQLANADSHGKGLEESRLNFLVSVVNGIGPRDTVEAMLAAQMAVVHVTSMTFARRLRNVETIQQQDSAERAFNKLTRTFATQMEALKRYRSRGEPKVTLQQVSVSEGGQAIVGDVTHAATEKVPQKAAASPSADFTGTNVVPMPIGDDGKERAVVVGGRKSAK